MTDWEFFMPPKEPYNWEDHRLFYAYMTELRPLDDDQIKDFVGHTGWYPQDDDPP